MTIGLVKESMDLESRVALVPDDVALIVQKGVEVLVENNAGANSGYSNEAYESVGAKIVDPKTAWGQDLVVKCKEPLEHEYPLLKEKATLFSYLDLAYQKSLCEMFIDKKITSICTETIAGPKNDYPILAPMSVVAGRLAALLKLRQKNKCVWLPKSIKKGAHFSKEGFTIAPFRLPLRRLGW
ncbi:hypothetical protein Q6A68_01540, partial [Helicobacter pylori]|nr:hypothetical protein [Helicobacter pylori]